MNNVPKIKTERRTFNSCISDARNMSATFINTANTKNRFSFPGRIGLFGLLIGANNTVVSKTKNAIVAITTFKYVKSIKSREINRVRTNVNK